MISSNFVNNYEIHYCKIARGTVFKINYIPHMFVPVFNKNRPVKTDDNRRKTRLT